MNAEDDALPLELELESGTWVEVRTVPLEPGRTDGPELLFVRDLTERQQTEMRLHELQSELAIGEATGEPHGVERKVVDARAVIPLSCFRQLGPEQL